ncbi:uncharacterized protein EI90DRAFT_3016129 [Cantharellus anzutake]|uniref:uncharacterized protein n=1 Tax=Cantharellus anzutake TaxID=1750568 RepID=UPI0019038A4C|nr:uncharacterized protein EI90DRAFT_3016129 [Cantharellus anzutake]KAF8332031.1 hypothetical protein EI90DRAFT_3016129 [Cantharellus anzutake]
MAMLVVEPLHLAFLLAIRQRLSTQGISLPQATYSTTLSTVADQFWTTEHIDEPRKCEPMGASAFFLLFAFSKEAYKRVWTRIKTHIFQASSSDTAVENTTHQGPTGHKDAMRKAILDFWMVTEMIYTPLNTPLFEKPRTHRCEIRVRYPEASRSQLQGRSSSIELKALRHISHDDDDWEDHDNRNAIRIALREDQHWWELQHQRGEDEVSNSPAATPLVSKVRVNPGLLIITVFLTSYKAMSLTNFLLGAIPAAASKTGTKVSDHQNSIRPGGDASGQAHSLSHRNEGTMCRRQTVVIKPSTALNLSRITLARVARQLVVQEGFCEDTLWNEGSRPDDSKGETSEFDGAQKPRNSRGILLRNRCDASTSFPFLASIGALKRQYLESKNTDF